MAAIPPDITPQDPVPSIDPAYPGFPDEPGVPEIGDPIPERSPEIPGTDDPFGMPEPPGIPEIGDPIGFPGSPDEPGAPDPVPTAV